MAHGVAKIIWSVSVVDDEADLRRRDREPIRQFAQIARTITLEPSDVGHLHGIQLVDRMSGAGEWSEVELSNLPPDMQLPELVSSYEA